MAGANATYLLSLRLNSGPDGVSAFFIELALALPRPSPPDCLPSPAWPGYLACTADDPVGLVRIAGVCDCNTTEVFEILTLEWPDLLAEPPAITHARVETIGPRHHTTLYSVAGRFGAGPLPLPDVPPTPLLDLATAWRLPYSQETLAACLVLAERLRVVADAMLYSTSAELTLMVRLTDRRGAPDPARTALWLYLSPTSAPEWGQIAAVWQAPPESPLWTPAPLYDEDGWYGFQYRGPVPSHNLSVSLYQYTLGPGLAPQPLRARVHGAIPPQLAGTDLAASADGLPYATLALGAPQPGCPWSSRAPAALVLTFTALLQAPLPPLPPTYAQLQEAARVLACNLSVAARRVAVQVSPLPGTLTLTVAVESFLRAYDVRLALSDPQRVLSLLAAAGLAQLRLTPAGLRSLAAKYAHDPPDPPAPCPRGYYFTDSGFYRPAPAHSRVGPDCYGFTCSPGYTLEPHATSPVCVPEFVPDWIFWTVVCLVSTMAFTVIVCACTLRLLCARKPRPEPDSDPEPLPPLPPPPDNTLPVGVTPDGNLLFEAVISSDSEFSSSSSDSDELEIPYAEFVPGGETESAGSSLTLRN